MTSELPHSTQGPDDAAAPTVDVEALLVRARREEEGHGWGPAGLPRWAVVTAGIDFVLAAGLIVELILGLRNAWTDLFTIFFGFVFLVPLAVVAFALSPALIRAGYRLLAGRRRHHKAALYLNLVTAFCGLLALPALHILPTWWQGILIGHILLASLASVLLFLYRPRKSPRLGRAFAGSETA